MAKPSLDDVKKAFEEMGYNNETSLSKRGVRNVTKYFVVRAMLLHRFMDSPDPWMRKLVGEIDEEFSFSNVHRVKAVIEAWEAAGDSLK